MPYVLSASPGQLVDLTQVGSTHTIEITKEQAEAETKVLGQELTDLQELLYAAGQNALLIVLQGRDTSGKDGTIRHLLKYMNAQGTRIAPFKVPTPKELAHDYLWRVHMETPGKGESVIFNRSHYEDVLVVRVHSLVPKERWAKRYEQINEFEELLTENDTILLKFFLHISKEEQEERLLAREQDTEKAWKLNVGDWKERAFWDAYTEAYQDAISKCSKPNAIWNIVPADKKWFRDLAITEAIVYALRPYRKHWMEKLEQIGKKAKEELAAYRAENS